MIWNRPAVLQRVFRQDRIAKVVVGVRQILQRIVSGCRKFSAELALNLREPFAVDFLKEKIIGIAGGDERGGLVGQAQLAVYVERDKAQRLSGSLQRVARCGRRCELSRSAIKDRHHRAAEQQERETEPDA